MYLNCQSIVNKKHEFHILIDTHNPDIVIGTESWLTKEHLTSEIFPSSLGYTIFRRDRQKGKGGGVFILVKNKFISSSVESLNTSCEILWVKIHMKAVKPLYVASYYRPNENQLQSIIEFEKSLELTRPLKGTKWIFGDFNTPKLAWDSEHLPSLKSNSHQTYDKLLEMLDDHNLTQMVNSPTRNNNILDWFLTSNPTLVSNITVQAGISDHNIVIAQARLKPQINKQTPRTIHLFKKANWNDFKAFINRSKVNIINNADVLSVEDIWTKFTNMINEGINKFVPIKKIGTKKLLPWVTQDIKRLIRKRDSIYQKVKKHKGQNQYKIKFKSIKHLIQSKIKKAYEAYIENILDIQQIDDTASTKFNTKKFYSIIKNTKQDNQGISPLKDQLTGLLTSDNLGKANILNRQFQSVFSKVNPLSLSQLSEKILGKPKYPIMKDIVIDPNGVLKLLLNLKVDKAAGPDNIKPIVLKELAHEILDVVSLIFQKSLNTGQIPSEWKKANVAPLYKKVILATQQTIGQYL